MLLLGIVAGEASGDILGARLMASIKQQLPYTQVEFIGVGGPLMEQEGLQSLFPMETLSVMGLIDVIKQLPRLLAARKAVIQTMKARQPVAFIGIDSPDFNLPIELQLKNMGIKTVHYVSPSVWAWRPKRIYKIKEAVDEVLSILPFEVDFYKKYGATCTFIGHPLADEIPLQTNKIVARERLNLPTDRPLVAILPGSRKSEVHLLLDDFLSAAKLINAQIPDVAFLIPFANEARQQQIEQQIQDAAIDLPIYFFKGQSRVVMEAADSCILTSGTVALEAMLLKRPMVVSYKFSWLNYHILKNRVQVKYFTLPNLLANKPLVPELLQEQVTPERIAEITLAYLNSSNRQLIQHFNEIHQQIRCQASERAATRVLQLIEQTGQIS